jgi:hypothetical protein
MLEISRLILFLPVVFLAGCQSGVTHYIAPEVTGRVLAADTHQPLSGATVQRGGSNQGNAFQPPKGGQVLIQYDGVRTDADGKFVLQSKSVIALFRSPGWWSAPVMVSYSGYETFQTNYTGDNVVTNTSDGPPLVDAGDILLHPLAK